MNTRTSTALVAGAALILGGLWVNGSLDGPLSHVGLNANTCTETLLGNRICGDELVSFCRERYDADLNSSVCDDVLRDEGFVPSQVAAGLAEQDQARERADAEAEEAAADERRRAAAIPTKLGEEASVGDIAYTVKRVSDASQIAGAYTTETARKGRHFVIADIEYANHGTRPVDVMCAFSSAQLYDGTNYYSLDDEATGAAPANSEACSEKVQQGDSEDATLVFEVRESVVPTDLAIWDPSALGPEGEDPYLVVGLAGA